MYVYIYIYIYIYIYKHVYIYILLSPEDRGSTGRPELSGPAEAASRLFENDKRSLINTWITAATAASVDDSR